MVSLDRIGIKYGMGLNVDDLLVIPVGWFRAQYALGNLSITKSVDDMLDSEKLSDRLMGEMLLSFACSEMPWGLDPNTEPSFAAFDFKRKKLVELVRMTNDGGMCCREVVFVYGDTQVNLMWWLYNGGIVSEVKMLNVNNAAAETRWNMEYVKYFRRKFPFALNKRSPFHGPVVGDVKLVTPRLKA